MTLPKLNKEFSVSFEFKATKYISGWQSVIHFTEDGNGQSIPAFWVKDSGYPYPTFAVSGDDNYGTLTPIELSLNEWHTVEFSQTYANNKYIYQVKIDGSIWTVPVQNRQPKTFSNVKVYAADPWYAPLQGSLRNLIITTENSNKYGGMYNNTNLRILYS